MTINKLSITSSADGVDIFVLADEGAVFDNFGTLTTSGNSASPVWVSADNVTVINHGSMQSSGAGSAGILVGSPDQIISDVTVINYGSIATSGPYLPATDIYSDGIELFANDSLAVNYGSIQVDNRDSAGISLVASGTEVDNFGSISTQGFGIVVVPLFGGEGDNIVVNRGMITTFGPGDARAIEIASDFNSVTNYGIIKLQGANDIGIALESIGAVGFNYGSISALADGAFDLLLAGFQQTFTNVGTMTASGKGGLGVLIAGEEETFVNNGLVKAGGVAVQGGPIADHVVNSGTIIGDVRLAGGNDTFEAGSGGKLSGILHLGRGDDMVVLDDHFGKLTIDDFAAGSAGGDVIDVRGLGIHSFAELLAHASQVGADVTLNFGPGEHLVLESVQLASLDMGDFLF